MSESGCRLKKISVGHRDNELRPEELLNFIESSEFKNTWDSLGLDLEFDATSLQLCIMANAKGYPIIDGSDGVRRHIHSFKEWGIDKPSIGVYYAYFEEFGIAYFVCIDEGAEDLEFTGEQLMHFRGAMQTVKDGLARRGTIR